tara:strand:- start:191 stop:412 length:222 start_codon:yes stop_codon:yes gene_type:complete
MNKSIILEQCLNFLKSEEIKKELKEIMKPITDYIYKEFALYLYILLFFITFSIILNLGILILLLRYNKNLLNK